jgi:hypothetical protein
MAKMKTDVLHAILCAAALFICASQVWGVEKKKGIVRYEAENAKIVNSTHKKADAPAGCERQVFYSGKLAAGGLNTATALADVKPDWSNIAYVSFTNVAAAKTGKYTITIAYNGDDDKTILIRTNDGKVQVVSMPRVSGGAWDRMHKIKVEVELSAGENVLDVSGAIGNKGWENIDYIEVGPAE